MPEQCSISRKGRPSCRPSAIRRGSHVAAEQLEDARLAGEVRGGAGDPRSLNLKHAGSGLRMPRDVDLGILQELQQTTDDRTRNHVAAYQLRAQLRAVGRLRRFVFSAGRDDEPLVDHPPHQVIRVVQYVVRLDLAIATEAHHGFDDRPRGLVNCSSRAAAVGSTTVDVPRVRPGQRHVVIVAVDAPARGGIQLQTGISSTSPFKARGAVMST